MTVAILSKSQAQSMANALRAIPDEVIVDINNIIVRSIAEGKADTIYNRPMTLELPAWNALLGALVDKGYKVKADSAQRDGCWVTITF